MALARIITRSHPCSRQLALDLIARGYAVEIVSPDSIPDNLADLELRVEEDPGNQLVASVEAHNGERSASFEFLHYLKAPMPDFIRRPPPEPHEAVHVDFPEPPVSVNVERSAEPVELPENAPQLAPETVSPAAEILRDRKLDPAKSAPPILAPDPSPSRPVVPPCDVALGTSTPTRPTIAKPAIPQPAIPKPTIAKPTIARTVREWEWRDVPAGWSSLQVALTVVSAVLLGLVLGYAMRRTTKASAQSSGPVATKKVAAASTSVSSLSAGNPKTDAGKNLVSPAIKPAIKTEQISDHMPKESPGAQAAIATATAATAGGGAIVSRRHGDNLIAPDTVTYFHQPSFDEAASRTKTSQPQPISGKRDGVIAENTVTVLNSNPASKAAKQDSGIKRYSDLK
jgi:hypothetical protein